MRQKLQIVYSSSNENGAEIHRLFQEEAEAMRDEGILVGTTPFSESTILMYRGLTVIKEDDYPKDNRFMQGFQQNIDYLLLSRYFPHISDLSIETFFVDLLDSNLISLINKRGWSKVFIKREMAALEHIGEGKSVWPTTSLSEIKKLYEDEGVEGLYAIRKFIEKEIIVEEERYWVLNGNIYHRYHKIPKVVKEAANRLNKFGSKYYTIDATTEFVVEVNPGESSDRHAVNPPELFASWFRKEFAR